MRIAIDAKALGSKTGGDETYMRNLSRTLAAIDPGNDYILFLNQPLPDSYVADAGIERMRRIVLREKLFRRIPISMPLAVVREHINVLHAQYAGPPFCPAPVVVTIHDLSFEHYPQFFDRGALLQLRASVPLSIRRAAAVLTVSEFSKRDIVRRYCVPSERVFVAPNAPEPTFQQMHDIARLEEVRERYDTGKHYILCVGNLQPRKNLRTLIDAYVRLRQADAIRHKLVLVGRKGWLYDDIFATARASGFSNELVFTDYVPQKDLVAMYNAADLFVYPSIFEGFGIPPLEAMACGTPVVTSNTSSLPEVVGDAALTVDPLDVEALAGAITRVLNDMDLQSNLTVLGLRRAALFSWDATARTILDVYRGVAYT